MFNIPIGSLLHTSPVTIKRFKSLGINTYFDLINYFPYRYENYSIVSTIDRLQPGETVTVKGEIVKTSNLYLRGGLKIQKVEIKDPTGKINLIWFNQPYLIRLFKKSGLISVSGTVDQEYGAISLKPQGYELLKTGHQPTIHTGRIVPIYSEKNGLSSKIIREKIYFLLFQQDQILSELLPDEIISYNNLMSEHEAYINIHFPENLVKAEKARERLAFDELFTIHLSNMMVKKQWASEKTGHQFILNKDHQSKLDGFIKRLPFQLTHAQEKAIAEILHDLQKDSPMNRLLQGEVGSGKTVVAALAAYLTFLNGYQTLFMAPTEILARQHFQTIKELFMDKLKISLVTGSIKTDDTKHTQNADIIIGTQALIQKKMKFNKVGFVIVDEQHRFGVAQRAIIKEKGISPHLLTMTATPIPRTVALTIYGELDISTIDQMPKNRLPVKTYLVPPSKRLSSYDWIKREIDSEKTQVFIICPLIEESEIETMKSVKAAKIEYLYLKNKIFPNYSVGLIHGKIKSKEKNQIMADFKNKKYDIMVATSVVEVGIDIANATIIIIEGSERYGLAQLHQLRGRVGRGNKQSYCLLFAQDSGSKVISRLSLFVKTNDGNKLAEYDIRARGAGQIYGTKQHGVTELKIASLFDHVLIKKSKSAAFYFNSNCRLHNYSELASRLKKYQINLISRD